MSDYPNEIYEQANLMPGDKAKWTGWAPGDILIALPLQEYPQSITFKWITNPNPKKIGTIDSGAAHNITKISSTVASQSTKQENTSSAYCTCNGPLSITGFGTLVIHSCSSCKKEKLIEV